MKAVITYIGTTDKNKRIRYPVIKYDSIGMTVLIDSMTVLLVVIT